MDKILALRQERADHINELTALSANAEKQGRDLNEEELPKWNEHFAKAEELKRRIEREEKVAHLNRDINTIDDKPVKPNPGNPETKDTGGFEGLGEFFYALRFERNDPRIRAALDMNIGESGGYKVPPAFQDAMYSVSPQEAAVRPRATVIPAGDMPDQEMMFTALDQTSNQNMYGGVTLGWTKSGTLKPETDMKLRTISLKPEEYAGWIEITDQLLRNWRSAGSFIESQFRMAGVAFEDNAFLTGDGVGKPLGVLSSDALYSVNRALANQIGYADLRGMYTRFYKRGTMGVWLITPAGWDQLMQIEDSEGHLIWNENARDGLPGTIFGMPVMENERNPALGSKGDIGLYDFSYYLIKNGSGPFVASSEHVKFLENRTVLKFFYNVDGQPWLTEPITGEGGYQTSPFVALDVPA